MVLKFIETPSKPVLPWVSIKAASALENVSALQSRQQRIKLKFHQLGQPFGADDRFGHKKVPKKAIKYTTNT